MRPALFRFPAGLAVLPNAGFKKIIIGLSWIKHPIAVSITKGRPRLTVN